MKKQKRSDKNHAQYRHVVDSVLGQILFDGWTKEAFAAGLQQAGLSAEEGKQLFPHGIRDVIDAFTHYADEAMQKAADEERGFSRFRVRDKIAFLVRSRLEFLTPHREAARRLSIWYAMPHNAIGGIKSLAKTVDLMWIAAGDTATDYNRYTKRILLGAVLKATTLFWFSHDTPDSAATWEFLDRRIAEIMRLGKSLSLLQEFSPSEIRNFIRRKMGRA